MAKKKVLILGGTVFIGRVLVEEFLKQPQLYDICLFNRGKTNPDLFKGARLIVGDRRSDDINKIGEEEWDAVIDISSYFSKPLEQAVAALKGKTKRYVYISTGSVYDLEQCRNKDIDEDAPKLVYTDEMLTDKSMAYYGHRKRACEDVLLEQSDLDPIILRPSVVYGKYDPFDRHYHWLYRIWCLQRLLLPDEGKVSMSFTFVEDLAQLIIKAIDIPAGKHRRVYNTNTHEVISLRKMLDIMAEAAGCDPKYVHVDADWLAEKKVQPWKDLPFWTHDDILRLNNKRIVEDFGVDFTSIKESYRRTAAYYGDSNWRPPKYGLSLEREEELLSALRS